VLAVTRAAEALIRSEVVDEARGDPGGNSESYVNRRRPPSGHTTLLDHHEQVRIASYGSAVSLHAHTSRSREVLTDAPKYLDRIPLVAPLVRREVQAYACRNGFPIDFKKAWWHPPLSGEEVFDSEALQIRDRLGVQPLVSITDHNSIDANLRLVAQPRSRVPISVEWTVPFDRGFFHLGVHNLKPDSAVRDMRTLAAYTETPAEAQLADLLEMLAADRETLVVLNHPLWDLAGIGPAHHVRLLRDFLAEHLGRIHAFELNGYRSRRENDAVKTLAEVYSMPLISGGDRHGCAPNSLLNLTMASRFGEFADEVRLERHSVVVAMPHYRAELVTRKLAVAADAMRSFPGHPSGKRLWTNRVSYEEEGQVQTLADSWPDGGPPWVRLTVKAFQLGTSAPMLPLTRMLVRLAGASNSHRIGPAELIEAAHASPASPPRLADAWVDDRDGSRPLTVAMVCDGVGDVVAGSFISTARFAERLKARGHRVVFISSGPWRRREDDFRGMKVHRLAGVLVPWSDGQLHLAIPRAGRLRAILQDERVDIVKVMIPMPLGLVASRVARSLGIPVVMHSHTQPENIFMNAPLIPGREALTRHFSAYLTWLYGQADVIFHPSAFSQRQFPELLASRHVVVSNGVDLERFQPRSPDAFVSRYQLSKAKQHLLYLGRLHPEKNVETLIRAMPIIVRQHPETHLVIVGQGHQKAMLTALARQSEVADHVTFCGFVPDEDLPSAYAACDLFVLPSLAELEGMVVLEAMACAKPLLIADSRHSAATEFVKDNGVLFRAQDPEHLADQAVRLLSNPDRLRAMAQVSLKKSRSFDINLSAAAIESVYYSLLHGDDRARA